MSKRRGKDLVAVGEMPLLKHLIREAHPTPLKDRLTEAAVQIAQQDEPLSILYQHSALCQTFLPFRNPGDDALTWQRANGSVHLEIAAGKAMHPLQNQLVQVGLPFGPKARMVLMHVNQQALIAKSPEIEVQNTLTKFVSRTLSLDTDGRTIRTVKDQLARLSASHITLGIVKDGRARTVHSQIVTAFDIWFPKDDRQRVLWPSTIRLSLDYWESLKAHAVPLDESAVAALSHSALALDVYAWLAQRLHRIPATGRPPLIVWPLLHDQFGPNYQTLFHFRAAFKAALKQVAAVYPSAKFEIDRRGMTLKNSAAPVAPRLLSSSAKP